MDGYNGYNQIRMVEFLKKYCNLWMEENVYEQSTNVGCTKLDQRIPCVYRCIQLCCGSYISSKYGQHHWSSNIVC